MGRATDEVLIRNIALVAMLAQLIVLLSVVWSLAFRELPGFVGLLLTITFFASPVVACGVIVFALTLRAQGRLRLRHKAVALGLIFAATDLVITAVVALIVHRVMQLLSGRTF